MQEKKIQEKKISVIIPCYNAERYLDVCLESLLNQTIGLSHLEIILINDASTDKTLEKMCEYEALYPEQIMVINYETNRRQGYARNLGLEYSTAEYVTFLDVDDYVAPNMMERMYNKIREGNYDYVICNYYRVINQKPMIMEEDVLSKEVSYEINTVEERKAFILTDTPFKGSCGTFYRKSFLQESQITFPTDTVYEDLYWLGLLRLYGRRVCVIPDRLYYYVNWDNSSVLTTPNSENHFQRLYVMELFLKEVRKRGFCEEFRLEIEMHFLQIYYINTISFFALRFTKCPLEVVLNMREVVLREIPDYEKNPYLAKCFDFEKTIVSLIGLNLRRQEEWDSIFQAIRESVTE